MHTQYRYVLECTKFVADAPHHGHPKEHKQMNNQTLQRNSQMVEERVRMNVGYQDQKEHVASIENLPYGQDFRGEEIYMWHALAQICVCMCLIESLSVGHYGQMFVRLSYGRLISKRSQDEKQSVFLSPHFFFTTNGKITAQSDNYKCMLTVLCKSVGYIYVKELTIISKWFYRQIWSEKASPFEGAVKESEQ